MKVRDLIIKLQNEDQEKEVFISRDEEGNGYGSISETSIESTSKAIIIYPAIEYIDEDLIFSEED